MQSRAVGALRCPWTWGRLMSSNLLLSSVRTLRRARSKSIGIHAHNDLNKFTFYIPNWYILYTEILNIFSRRSCFSFVTRATKPKRDLSLKNLQFFVTSVGLEVLVFISFNRLHMIFSFVGQSQNNVTTRVNKNSLANHSFTLINERKVYGTCSENEGFGVDGTVGDLL